MPRPKRSTEQERLDLLRQQEESWSQILEEDARAFAKSSGEPPLFQFEKRPDDHRLRLKTDLHIDAGLDLTRDFSSLLLWLSQELRLSRYNRATRPTPDRIARSVSEGAKYAWKLREWSQALQPDLFHDVPVFIAGTPPVRAVIQHLADTFDRMLEIYPRKGRGKPPGTRDDAQWVAVRLMVFTYRHAPKATETQRRDFVRNCLVDLLKIHCPNPDNHTDDFTKWFRPVEAQAKHAEAKRRARLLAKEHFR